MDKALKIAGVIVVAWIVLSLVGMLLKLVVGAVFWIGLIAAGVWLVAVVMGRKPAAVSGRRNRTLR